MNYTHTPSVVVTSAWVRSSGLRRAGLLAGVAAVALSGGLLVQNARTANLARPSATAALSQPAPGVLPADGPAGSVPASPALASAPSAISLSRGAPLPAVVDVQFQVSAASAVGEAGAAVADAVYLNRLQAQLQAPAPVASISSDAVNRLAQLVQQEQVSSHAAVPAPVIPLTTPLTAAAAAAPPVGTPAASVGAVAPDAAATPAAAPTAPSAPTPAAPSAASGSPASSALAQAESDVRDAQAALVAATDAADHAVPSPTQVTAGAAAGTPATPVPESPALQQARLGLGLAQQQLLTLLTPPTTAQVAAAQNVITNALAATPTAPSVADLASAQAAVLQAQQLYIDESKPPTQAEIAKATGNDLERLLRGPDPQPIAQALAFLKSAQAALATLKQNAAYAAKPETQPAVIQARAALAQLVAPPDPSKVADAQAAVTAAQKRIDSLVAVAAASVATPTAAAAAPVTDAVKAAEARLAAAQARLRTLVTASTAVPAEATPAPTASATAAPATPTAAATATPPGAGGAVLPVAPADSASPSQTTLPSGPDAAVAAGSTVTAPDDPAITAGEAQLAAASTASSTALVANQVGLQAVLVEDALLQALHLHPSAFALPATPALGAASASVSRPVQGAAFAWPASGPITQPFGVPELGVGLPHTGIDIGQGVGGPVLAAAPGVVSFAGGDPSVSYGYYVIVDHGMGVTTLYGHMALPPIVRVGQLVAQGSLLGLSGSSGFSTGPHVHFEIRFKGVPVDPLPLLRQGTGG